MIDPRLPQLGTNIDDLVAPGAQTGLAKQIVKPSVPLDWLLQQPTTRPWWAKAERANVGAAEIVDFALNLQPGYEGIVRRMVLLGKAGTQGANAGIGWAIYFNDVRQMDTVWQFGASVDTSGRFDYLDEGDGLGNSWGQIDLWIPEQSRVTVGMNNNGGTADAMGWIVRGYYWPVILRELWARRGWKK